MPIRRRVSWGRIARQVVDAARSIRGRGAGSIGVIKVMDRVIGRYQTAITVINVQFRCYKMGTDCYNITPRVAHQLGARCLAAVGYEFIRGVICRKKCYMPGARLRDFSPRCVSMQCVSAWSFAERSDDIRGAKRRLKGVGIAGAENESRVAKVGFPFVAALCFSREWRGAPLESRGALATNRMELEPAKTGAKGRPSSSKSWPLRWEADMLSHSQPTSLAPCHLELVTCRVR
jgi:hypothetical protein